MTLHELAEDLRKVAYDLDESHRLWDHNDSHVAELDRKIAALTARAVFAETELAHTQRRLGRLLAKRSKRPATKKARR